MPALRVALETAPLERIVADVAVASFFECDRPLRGAASRADWRLCGMLSELVAGGSLSGAAGEALLVPTFRRLVAPSLLLVGLGTPERFGAAEVATAVRDAVARLVALRVESAALAIPGEWIGAVPLRPAAEAATRGALAALAGQRRSLSLCIPVPESGVSRALRGLEAAASRARAEGITLQLADLEAAPGSAVRPARSAPGAAPISPAPGRP